MIGVPQLKAAMPFAAKNGHSSRSETAITASGTRKSNRDRRRPPANSPTAPTGAKFQAKRALRP